MKNIRLYITVLYIAIGCKAFSQPDIQWDSPLGGHGSELAYGIQQTADGGFIVCGPTDSNNGDVSGLHSSFYADFWLVKLDTAGNLVWQKCLGGSFDDYAYSIAVTADGGYIIAGSSDSNDGDVSENKGGKDYWIVKTDSLGTIEWQRSYGGSQNDEASSIQRTNDGGYIVAGTSFSDDGDITAHNGSAFTADYWVIKLDSSGIMQWETSAGGTADDLAKKIIQTGSSEYMIVGESTSDDDIVTDHHGFGGASDMFIVKLDSSGTMKWQRSYGGTFYDGGNAILQISDSVFVIAGYASSEDDDISFLHGDKDYWIIHINTDGDLLWEKTFGGSQEDVATQITRTFSGDYFITGYATSDDGDVTGTHIGADYWPLKIDTAGGILWEHAFGGNIGDYAYDGLQTNSGAYVMAGASNSLNGDVSDNNGFNDFWIIQLESDCAVVDAAFSYLADSNTVSFTDGSVNATSWIWDFGDGLSGTTQNPVHTYIEPGIYTACLTAMDSCSSESICMDITIEEMPDQILSGDIQGITVFPNPFSDVIHISTTHGNAELYYICLYDSFGNKVAGMNGTDKDINTTGLAKGIYILTLQTNGSLVYSISLLNQ